METQIAGLLSCAWRGTRGSQEIPELLQQTARHLASHWRSGLISQTTSPTSVREVGAKRPPRPSPGARELSCPIPTYKKNPLCPELGAGFSALTHEAYEHVSLRRQEQNRMIQADCSGSFVAFRLGLMVAGLIKEHVSSQHRLARLFKYLPNVFGIPC